MTVSAYGYNEINMTASLVPMITIQLTCEKVRMITMALTRHFPLITMRLHHSKFI